MLLVSVSEVVLDLVVEPVISTLLTVFIVIGVTSDIIDTEGVNNSL